MVEGKSRKSRIATIAIGLLAICMPLFSQIAFFWEDKIYFIDVIYFFNGILFLFYSLIIIILATGKIQKRIAYLLLIINIILMASYLDILT